jgi:solute carrier family 45 protein 1/2/4
VWIAGPLSGLVMQPIVGVIADRSRSKWGRRRPFMVGGAVIVGLCLLVLGWTKEIVGLFVTEPSAVGCWEHWAGGCETSTDGDVR